MKKPIFLLAIVGVLCVLGGLAWFRTFQKGSVQNGNATIVLTDSGFSPKTIRIRKGTTITFTTNAGRFFWPASDLHPSHGIYPAFDPKKPIPAAESWSFTFDRVGSWDFHDHLSPYYTGTITVVE